MGRSSSTVIGHGMMGDEYEGRVMGEGAWAASRASRGVGILEGVCCGAPPGKVGTVTRKYHTEKRQKA